IAVWDFYRAVIWSSDDDAERSARFAEHCPACMTEGPAQATGKTGRWTLYRFANGQPVVCERWTAPLVTPPEPSTVQPTAFGTHEQDGWTAHYVCPHCGHGWTSWRSSLLIEEAA